MGKICWINGQPYLVSLPRGGKGYEHIPNNPWDRLIDFFGENCDDLFHWWEMYSWCQEAVTTKICSLRGYGSARGWANGHATNKRVYIGFRPVLTPLDPDTLKPNPSLLEDIPDGSKFALASLYMNGKVIAEPQNPTDEGDIAEYIPRAKIILGDRDDSPENWLHVIKYRDLLWVDRNILNMISWKDLKAQGFTGGK